MQKVYVLDTSVLMHDPHAIDNFGDNTIVIPFWVTEELDQLKTGQNGKGKIAREAIASIEHYRTLGSLYHANGKPVATKHGGKIFVDYRGNPRKLPAKLIAKNDNYIIACAMHWQKEEREKKSKTGFDVPVILVTKDINMRIKGDACGLAVQDYENDKGISSADELYSGFSELELADEHADLIGRLYHDKTLPEDLVFGAALNRRELFPNACCHLKVSGNEREHAYAIYYQAHHHFRLVPWKERSAEKKESHKIVPINAEQALAEALLMNPYIPLVTLAGVAGTGKTLMALRAALHQLETNQQYGRITVLRPNKEIGKELGFLPGTVDDKFAPWMKPILKLLTRLLQRKEDGEREMAHRNGDGMYHEANKMIQSGRLEIIPINFLRGDNFDGEFVIVDEAQNLSPPEIKTVLTRAGRGTKFVLTGDIYQIDDPYLDPVSNGLSHTVERMKGHPEFAHLTLIKTERSSLAETAARLL